MIWAILAFLGIALWSIAVALLLLLRTRSQVGKIPGAVRCKVRTAAAIPNLDKDYSRSISSAMWVHDVLIVHSGPFLIPTTPLGISAIAVGPQPAEATERLKKFADPVSVVPKHDSGAEIEFCCSQADAGRFVGPFAR